MQNKYLINPAIHLLLIFFLASCGLFNRTDNKVEYLAVKIGKKDAKYSIINKDGKVIMEDEFASSSDIEISGDIITEELSSGEVKYWKLEGNKVKQFGNEKYPAGTPFVEGYAIVRNEKGMLSMIGDDGKEVIPNLSKIDNYTVLRVALPKEGLLRFKNADGLWGYLNTDGKVVIQPKFQACENFKNGLARVLDADGLFNIIDDNGEVKFKGKEGFSYKSIINGEYVPFKEEGSEFWGVMNFKGEEIIKDSKYKEIGSVTSDMIAVYKGRDEWGVVNYKDEIVGDLRTKFEKAALFNADGNVVVNADKEARLFDNKGNLVKKFDDFLALIPLAENRYLAYQKNDKFVIIDGEGKELSSDAFYADARYYVKRSESFDEYMNEKFTIESKYFDFEEVFKAAFSTISSKGIANVSNSSNIEAVLKAHPYNNSASNNRSVRNRMVDKSNDYGVIMQSAKKSSRDNVDMTEIEEDRTDYAAVTDTAGVAAPAIKDNYPYLGLYDLQYSTMFNFVANAGFRYTFGFDQVIKQEVTGPDPIFTNQLTTIGYELNKAAKLFSVTIEFDFYGVDQSSFYNAVKEKLESSGFKLNESSGLFHHKDNPNRVIEIRSFYVIYYFEFESGD